MSIISARLKKKKKKKKGKNDGGEKRRGALVNFGIEQTRNHQLLVHSAAMQVGTPVVYHHGRRRWLARPVSFRGWENSWETLLAEQIFLEN